MENARVEKLREYAAQAELQGNWDQAEAMRSAADWIIRIEAQNQTYRYVFANGITVHINNFKKRFFGGNTSNNQR